jgi:hypothetical protein
MTAEPFPVLRMAEVQRDLGRPLWLIESLWAVAGVGILGGHPKTGKTWLALDIALSVASATPCLDTFPVSQPGPVLLFLAEDSAENTHERVLGLCRHRGIELAALDLFLLSTPILRLNSKSDYESLIATVDRLRPRLLVLDPFVRVQTIDENSASEVSRLLADLTALKHTFDLAILLVHHTRKSGAGHPGQSLRGSGDLRAWGDTNLFLRQRRDVLQLAGEHRSAPAFEPISLDLVSEPQAHLSIVGNTQSKVELVASSLVERVIEALEQTARPLTRLALREHLRVNNQRLGDALVHLQSRGQIQRGQRGWQLAPSFCSKLMGQVQNRTPLRDTPLFSDLDLQHEP